MFMEKVIIGISGGVDSAVGALLLMKQGYEVEGLFMRNWDSNINNDFLGNPNDFNDICPQEKDYNDALELCNKLGIKLHRIDFIKEYWDYVFTYFLEELKKGRTPNPDMLCNKFIKFDLFIKEAKRLGADYIATGHYAKTEYSEEYRRWVLKKSNAGKKDQSYVLWNIPKDLISHVVFPLANFESKDEIREIARENNLKVANKPDSEDICFVPDGDYAKFLETNSTLKPKEGNIVTKDGTILGKHNGLYHYTIGQRKGLGISYKEPLFVIGFNKAKNELIVGTKADIYKTEMLVNDINLLLVDEIKEPIKVSVKTRYSSKEENATIEMQDKNTIKVTFEEPVARITPGQSAVFYIGDIVLGGGKIIG